MKFGCIKNKYLKRYIVYIVHSKNQLPPSPRGFFDQIATPGSGFFDQIPTSLQLLIIFLYLYINKIINIKVFITYILNNKKIY